MRPLRAIANICVFDWFMLQVEEYRGLHARFKEMQDENRHLYNTVQDLRGSIRVYCRIRPAGATGDHSTNIVEPGEEGGLAVYSHKHAKWHEFKFDRVFGEDCSQVSSV